jgi:uncharacterized DUF497 family protein
MYNIYVIVWDEAKRQSNLRKHGLDFADAHLVYDSPAKVTFRSSRNDEDRLVDLAMVKIAGTVLVLVYVERGRDIRVVSFRRSSRLERRIYEQALEEQD